MKTKKELKEAYNQIKRSIGVFQIKNTFNNMVLIDNSTDMISKWNRHRMELRFGNHRNKALQKDWNEIGEINFVFEILSELKYQDEVKINHRRELQILQNMLIEELNIDHESIYT